YRNVPRERAIVCSDQENARGHPGSIGAESDGGSPAIAGMDDGNRRQNAHGLYHQTYPLHRVDFRPADDDALATRVERVLDGNGDFALPGRRRATSAAEKSDLLVQ